MSRQIPYTLAVKQSRNPKRLPIEDYQGERTVCFHAVTSQRAKLFTSAEVVNPQVEYLAAACRAHDCVVPVYCFMPDHLHVMFMGLNERSNSLAAMNEFKLKSGKWMSRKKLAGWQGSYFDHIMRYGDDWRRHATYLAMNPVRAGLVENYLDYPFLGSIGCDLQDVVLRLD